MVVLLITMFLVCYELVKERRTKREEMFLLTVKLLSQLLFVYHVGLFASALLQESLEILPLTKLHLREHLPVAIGVLHVFR